MHRLMIPLALPALLAVGCVSAGDHEAVLKDLADTQKAMKDAEAAHKSERQDLKARIADEQKKRAAIEREKEALGERIAAAEASLKELETANTSLNDQLANVVKDKSRLKASVKDMKAALDELARRKAAADKRIAEFKGLLSRFKTLIDAGKLRVKIANGRMVVELATDILFASGSARLSKDGKTAIGEVTEVLRSIPDRAFQVEGHTDNVPIRTAQYPSNWELSTARAVTVVKAMIDAEMPTERVSAAGFADTRPATSNDTKEGKAANRRIEIVVVPDLSNLPGFDELNKASEA
jgi:chemotaxis protein MotB